MGNYEQLKDAIKKVIKDNGNQEITGLVLQNTLLSIVSSLGKYSNFAGIAMPTTEPGIPDQNVFYIATKAGTYVNFDRIVLKEGEAAILEWDRGIWTKLISGFATQEQLTALENKITNLEIPVEQELSTAKGSEKKVLSQKTVSEEIYGINSNVFSISDMVSLKIDTNKSVLKDNKYILELKKGDELEISFGAELNALAGVYLFDKDGIERKTFPVGKTRRKYSVPCDTKYISFFVNPKDVVSRGITEITIQKKSIESTNNIAENNRNSLKYAKILHEKKELTTDEIQQVGEKRCECFFEIGAGNVGFGMMTYSDKIGIAFRYIDKKGMKLYDTGWQKEVGYFNTIEYPETEKVSLYFTKNDGSNITPSDIVANVFKVELNKVGTIATKEYIDSEIGDTRNYIDSEIGNIDSNANILSESETIRCISHRGRYGVGIAQQNTLSAVVAAKRQGYKYVENDVAITKDNKLVCWHDGDLVRLGTIEDVEGYLLYFDSSNSPYWVKGSSVYTYDYLQKKYIVSSVSLSSLTKADPSKVTIKGENFNFLRRINFASNIGIAPETIPTFEEWVLLSKKIGVNIYVDFKIPFSDVTDEIAKELATCVIDLGMTENATWLGNFDKIRKYIKNARLASLSNPTPELVETFQKYKQDGEVIFNGSGKTLTKEMVKVGIDGGYNVECWYVDYGGAAESNIFGRVNNLVSMGITGISLDVYRLEEIMAKELKL